MSWQRIDENTYIDDTLVTCAEYQLFIDEMRERSIYHQPDHWVSFQFAVGKAREPILGVRRSDAEAFCEWLEERENLDVRYRLPTYTEATQNPLKSSREILLIGYFTGGIEDQYQWGWIGDLPSNARALEVEKVLEYAKIVDLNSSFEQFFSQKRIGLPALVRSKSRYDDKDLTDILVRSLNRPLNTEFDRDETLTNRDNVPRFIFLLAVENSLRNRVNFYTDTDSFKELFYGKFIDLYTLQERIAGRSPAFEGIRLVKERIK